MLGIEVDGYSHEFVLWKGWSEGKPMNELGLLFWDLAMNRFKKNDMAIEFYIWEMKTHPLKRGVRSIRKKSWFNFQNYWYGVWF
jgi:hypothetical protein